LKITNYQSPIANYRMPAEWEPHEATWLAWPHNRSDWPGKYPPIPWVYAEIVRCIAKGERVHIVVQDRGWEEKARGVLSRAGVPVENVRFHWWRTNRGWTRDSGAIFVRSGTGGAVGLNCHFNGWAKYTDWKLDIRLPVHITRFLAIPCIRPVIAVSSPQLRQFSNARPPASPRPRVRRSRSLVLEGGAIDVNGLGTLMATEECLLSRDKQVRNPGTGRAELEAAFQRYFGAAKVIWLGRGIAGDDTHGHVDDIARFVGPRTVVAAVENNPEDPNYAPLQENLECLRTARDQDGRPLRVVELPMPAPVVFRGRRLPASYANFYIANAAVLVPTFNHPNDRVALNILAEFFPGRQVTGIYCGDLVWGLGTIHCMTQQQPGARSR
jgi:agmatine deiminase